MKRISESIMPILVKTCGLTTEKAVLTALEHGADFFGFVFHPASPRHLNIEKADALFALLPEERRKDSVAVMVNPNESMLAEVLGSLRFGYVQLHGRETPARADAIRQHYGIPIIKAFPVAAAEDLDAAAQYQDSADMFLFDAKSTNPAMPGGTGKSFDWSLLSAFGTEKPWFLSGGITRENADAALRQSGARMLDLSSSLESAPGIKDPEKMIAFLNHVKKN